MGKETQGWGSSKEIPAELGWKQLSAPSASGEVPPPPTVPSDPTSRNIPFQSEPVGWSELRTGSVPRDFDSQTPARARVWRPSGNTILVLGKLEGQKREIRPTPRSLSCLRCLSQGESTLRGDCMLWIRVRWTHGGSMTPEPTPN